MWDQSLICPFMDPALLKLGRLSLNWYGIMYTLGAGGWYLVTRSEIKRRSGLLTEEYLPELLFDGLICGVIGARIGYILLYNFSYFMGNPWEIFAFWHGGMSAHGWLVGMAVGGLVFVREHKVPVRDLADTVYLGLPLGIAAVKIGNLINCEGFGGATDLPWGVIVPSLGMHPRHPSQLYEAMLEGILLFAVLWKVRRRQKRAGDLSCLFLVGYGCLRFFIEFSREPDLPWQPPFATWVTMGQVLSVLVVAFGVVAYVVGEGSRIGD